MSLTAAANIALSGISTAQQGLRTTSNNITNVNTDGYDRRVQIQQAKLAGTDGAGVEVAEVQRIVDTFLQKQMYIARADSARYASLTQLYERLEAVLGSPSDNSSLPGRLDALFGSLGALAIEPDSAVRRSNAVTDLELWADEVTRLSTKIQELRQEADRQIVAAITDINTQIQRVHELNATIARETFLGRDTGTYKEQQEDALAKLSGYIDIGTYDMGTGQTGVTGANGIVLVDSSFRQLDYTAAGTVSTATQFSQIMVRKTLPGTTTMTGTGTALDPNRATGKIDGLLRMRDLDLPKFAQELGEIASVVVDKLNAAHNDNSSVPAQTSFTGRNSGILSTDTVRFTGKVTLAALDSSNNYTTRVVIDFDASTIDNGGGATAIGGSTYASLVSAINGANGFNGTASVSLSAGVLTFAKGTAAGVAMVQDSTSPSALAGRGFAHYFGLNDLLTATGETHYDTGFTASDAHALTSGGKATFQLRNANGEVAVSYELTVTGSTWQNIIDALNATSAMGNYVTFSMNSSGALVSTPATNYSDYEIVVSSDTTSRGATQQTISGLFGIGTRYQADAAQNVQVLPAIVAAPSKMALSKLDTSSAAIAGTTPALTPGDNRGAVALQAIERTSVSFAAAGHLAATTGTLSEYSANVLSDIANKGAIVEQLESDRKAYTEALSSRITDLSGVNLDEELANMIVYQNAFTASARIIASVQEMFDALLAAV